MINLLMKDFRFTKKWVLFAAIYGVVMTYIMSKETQMNPFFVYFLIPFFVVLFPLGKIMNMEDNQDTRDFLRRLPYSARKRVLARVIYIAGLLIGSIICIVAVQWIMEGISLEKGMFLNGIIIMLCFMSYFLVQLAVFYKKSYHAAQSCVAFAALGAMALSFISKSLNIEISLKEWSKEGVIVGLLLLNLLLFEMACRCEKKHK